MTIEELVIQYGDFAMEVRSSAVLGEPAKADAMFKIAHSIFFLMGGNAQAQQGDAAQHDAMLNQQQAQDQQQQQQQQSQDQHVQQIQQSQDKHQQDLQMQQDKHNAALVQAQQKHELQMQQQANVAKQQANKTQGGSY